MEVTAARLAGLPVLVTGAGGGIGAAICRRLGAEGANVGVADVRSEASADVAAEITRAGGKAMPLSVDVRRPEQIELALDQFERAAGAIYGVVTAAGIATSAPFLELSPEAWDRTMAINLTGTFLVIQAVCRRLARQAGRGGRVVAISSIAGRGARADLADYAASKAGVISLVRSVAVAMASHAVTVNAICPGVVDTEMVRRLNEERASVSGRTANELKAQAVAAIPLGRIGTPEDMAGAAAFLLSADAAFMTGQAINVDGGVEFD